MNQLSNKSKLFYSFTLELKSPISVGNGDDIMTDHDIIRYHSGSKEVYIPATTIAGCLFSKQNKANNLYSIGDTSSYSPLFVSDGNFTNDNIESFIGKRDGNKLDYITKTSLNTAVYNYQIVEKGAKFNFFIEYTIKENSNTTTLEVREDILEICSKINNGLYRIGFKQNRGLGRLKVESIKEKIFDFKDSNFNLAEYIKFLNNASIKLDENLMKDITSQIKEVEDERDTIIKKIRPVSLINIKTSSRLKEKTDTKALTLINNNKVAVIPGSSINGALRAYAYKLAKKDKKEASLFRDSANNDLNTNYVVDDLYIEGHLMVKQRTRINRFTGGADDKALFDEQVFVPKHLFDKEAKTLELRISFYNDIDEEAKHYLKKAVDALCNGMIALGAESNIGYGIFEEVLEGGC